jgi:hypothetical protein
MPHEEPEPTPTVAEAARDLMREDKVVAPPDLDGDGDDRAHWDELEKRTGKKL